MRADVVYAWPTAEIAVMGAQGAVNVIHRREIADAEDPDQRRAELIAEYEERFNNPYSRRTRPGRRSHRAPRDAAPAHPGPRDAAQQARGHAAEEAREHPAVIRCSRPRFEELSRMADMQSVLIANRGEIAVRVIRAAQEMGLRTIAVYSELDRDALHVELADEAWNIGPAPAAESYLNIDRILEVAREAKADAVHPGYGFLAENAAFAQAVIDAGLIWVGPSPEAIATMGDKIASRKAAAAAGVASVPGTLEPLGSVDDARVRRRRVRLPRRHQGRPRRRRQGPPGRAAADEVAAAFEGARREADAYFGNPEVYVEKYLERPRHIEAQIMFDTHGNALPRRT